MSNNPVRLQSGDGIPITQTDNALDVNIAGGASALPTGAATSAKQDTGNTSLSSINGKLPALVDGKIPVDASVSIDSLAKEATLASMSAGLGTIQTDLATVKADIALMKADLAKKLEKVQLHVAIDFSSASDHTIIAAPEVGNRIRLTRLSLISGSDPQVNVEIALKSSTTTIETVKGSAMVFDYPEHRNLETNEAFVVQCTTADRVIGGVDYYVEAV